MSLFLPDELLAVVKDLILLKVNQVADYPTP